jgi:hypothetical protein
MTKQIKRLAAVLIAGAMILTMAASVSATTQWTVGGAAVISISESLPRENFEGMFLGQRGETPIDDANFTVTWENPTVFTFTQAFAETLGVGEHHILANFGEHRYLFPLVISEPAATTNAPPTRGRDWVCGTTGCREGGGHYFQCLPEGTGMLCGEPEGHMCDFGCVPTSMTCRFCKDIFDWCPCTREAAGVPTDSTAAPPSTNAPSPNSDPRILDSFPTWRGTGSATVRIDLDHEDFEGLFLNGNAVDTANYTVTAGSTVITLNEDYLKSLGNGTHNFTATFAGGEVVNIPLTVNVASTGSGNVDGNPKTGVALVVMPTLIAGVAVVIAKKRK